MKLADTLTKPAYAVPELMTLTSVKRTVIYEEIRSGRLRATKLGRRTIILADDIVAWLEMLRGGCGARSGNQ